MSLHGLIAGHLPRKRGWIDQVFPSLAFGLVVEGAGEMLDRAGRRIAVLGRMGELGVESERGHRSVGEVAVTEGIDCIIGVGEEARWITDAAWRGGIEKVFHVNDIADAVKALRDISQVGDVVLVKGSRSARMERIVEGLQVV